MSFHLCHVKIILSLSLLLIGLGLCQGASLQRLRTQRDTRNIPSNLFRPLENPSDSTENNGASPKASNDFTLSEASHAEAHTVAANSSASSSLRQTDYEDDDDESVGTGGSSWKFTPRQFHNPTRVPFNTGFRSRNFEDVSEPAGFSRPKYGPTGLGGSGLRAPVYSTMPLSIRNQPQLNDFPDSFHSPYMGSRGSSGSNFYRSESYSYTSDGNGPPQVQRSVYDSRLGNGFSTRSF